jgi:ABC-type transport system involved in multi-copper enzyme maturation permease subunit
VQLLMVTAVAVFFSTFSTPILSAALTFCVYVAGYFSADLRNFDQVVDSRTAQALARGLYYVLPNFGPFDVTAQVVHGIHLGWRYVGATVAYGVTYIALLLVISVTIFSRRDFR